MNRKLALEALIEMTVPISEAVSRMSQFPWDSEEALALLTPAHLERALVLFMRNKLSVSDIETWANALECREDLDSSTPVVDEVLYELANPLLTHALSLQRATHLLSVLKRVG